MSTEEAKNADAIRIQESEEIIEEVIEQEAIEVEQVEWMGPAEVMEEQQTEYYNPDELLEDHAIVDFDDSEPYQSFLPIRDGIPVLSLNLPDLVSKTYTFSDSDRMVLCFNKKCQRQLTFDGFLYTIKDYLSETQWNNWRCVNPHCFGEIRTTPDFRELRECHEHVANCPQDELQIRIRIAIYDARLMAEFTDAPLETLYAGARQRIKTDIADAVHFLPAFDALKSTLEDHRINKIYRKRFEMQNLRDKQKKLNMTPDEVVYTENASGLIKFRRTKPFPTSICVECNDQLMSNHLPSQDHLIAHYMYTHGRRMTIERYEFKDVNMFDQYIRELNVLSRYKLKKMGLADENMYYLCTHDDRLAKNGVGRASRLVQQNHHCTAFIRVFDWRISSKREGSRILIDYCLEHQSHLHQHNSNGVVSTKGEIDYYTPEVFVRDIEERRARTQKLIGEMDPQKLKRPLECRSYIPSGRAKPSFGARSLAPPLAAQIAAGNTTPFVDIYEEQNSIANRPRVKFRQSIRTAYPKMEEEGVNQSEQASSSSMDPNLIPPPRVYITQKPYCRLTERQNFKDIYTFNAVCKMEDACLSLLNRMQNCQNARIGLAYREKIAFILRQANQDPALSEGTSAEEVNKSWVLERPLRGRPRKRQKMHDEDGEEDVVDDCDEEEEEEGQIDEQNEKESGEKTKKDESVSDATTRSSGRSRKVPARLVE